MANLNDAIKADAARKAYADVVLLATAARNAEKQMQWRAAGRLYDQAASALQPSPHGHDHPDELIYRARARICRAMTGCAHPMRPSVTSPTTTGACAKDQRNEAPQGQAAPTWLEPRGGRVRRTRRASLLLCSSDHLERGRRARDPRSRRCRAR